MLNLSKSPPGTLAWSGRQPVSFQPSPPPTFDLHFAPDAIGNLARSDCRWLEESSEDDNGRAIWALGHSYRFDASADIRSWALDWFDRKIGLADKFDSLCARAFAGLGAAHLLAANPGHARAKKILCETGEMLFQLLKQSSRPDWTWFETVLAHDNPRLAEGLIRAGDVCGNSDWVDTGIDALGWINRQQVSEDGQFCPVGFGGGRGYDCLRVDRQSVEAWSAIDACAAAHQLRLHDRWLTHAERAMRWLQAHNQQSPVPVERAANQNSSAESMLASHMGYQAYMRLLADNTMTAERSGIDVGFVPPIALSAQLA